MLTSNEIINVEGKTGRYTREYYSRDLFKPVTTEYNLKTRNLENYISRKLDNAKDITRVFKNLEKQGYTVTTVETVFGKVPCFNTEIGGIFNGNIRTINVLWSATPNIEETYLGFKQTIYATIK